MNIEKPYKNSNIQELNQSVIQPPLNTANIFLVLTDYNIGKYLKNQYTNLPLIRYE